MSIPSERFQCPTPSTAGAPRTALALALLLLGAGFAAADERPNDDAFFPLYKRCTWVYATTNRTSSEHFDMTVRIDGPWTNGAETGTIMTQTDPRGRMQEYLVRETRGYFIRKVAIKRSIAPEITTRFEPPIPRFFFPVEPGSSLHWEGRLKIAWIDKKIVFDGKVVGWEDVDVPAGRFHCIRLHFAEKRGEASVEEEAWYAPNVGQVKYIGANYIKELKSFQKP